MLSPKSSGAFEPGESSLIQAQTNQNPVRETLGQFQRPANSPVRCHAVEIVKDIVKSPPPYTILRTGLDHSP